MTVPTSESRGRGNLVWIGLIVVVVALGVIAVVVARGNKEESSSASTIRVDGKCPSSAPKGDGSEPLPQYEGAANDDAICRTIPTISGEGVLDGEQHTVKATDGKAKVLIFVAHWCPHCQREVPKLADHLNDEGMPDGVDLYAVSTNVEPSAGNYPPKDWLEAEDWPVTTIADDEASTAAANYGLSSFPYFVAVDDDGRVVYRTSGELSTEQFDALVEAARTGEPPS